MWPKFFGDQGGHIRGITVTNMSHLMANKGPTNTSLSDTSNANI